MNTPVTEAELQAWVDGRLPAGRSAAVADYLAMHPAEAARLQAYREQDAALRALYLPVLEEAVPPALQARPLMRDDGNDNGDYHGGASGGHASGSDDRNAPIRRLPARSVWRAAAMLALTLAGAAAGWLLRGAAPDSQSAQYAASNAPRMLAQRAALAHAVYTPEVRHPVEVGADQQAHLVAWLSKRLGAPLRPPQLQQQGYALEGGRLLPGQSGPVAQFMYRDAAGMRLTLYVSTEQGANHETAFRFAQQGQVGVFYWIDGKFGYALSGSVDKATLSKLADAVYAQLEPAS